MRSAMLLPFAAAFLLSACGGDKPGENAGTGMSAADVADQAEGLIQPKPGQYRTSLELLEFDAPGMPDGARQQMQEIFASGLAEGNTFCLTSEQAARNGPEEMARNLAEGDCKMTRFNVAGSTVAADMQCTTEGMASTIRLAGEMGAEHSNMTMEMNQDVPQMGKTHMKMRVTTQRIGDCAG